MSKSSELDQHVKRHILDNVTGEDYGKVTETTAEKVQFLKETFEAEMGWRIDQKGRQAALMDWFQGLPTACTVAFQNSDILDLAREWGSLRADPTEREQEKILENWFKLVAAKTCQLFDGYRVPE